jgi:sulfite exporter TauE/SafE
MAGEALSTRGFGRALAIAAGLLLLAAAIPAVRVAGLGRLGRIGAGAAGRACLAAGRWSTAHPAAGPLLTGAANGLLPCGLVYAALTTAAALGNAVDAGILMAGFGVGTLPALVTLIVSATSLPPATRVRFRRLMPLALALTGVLLLARGMAPASGEAHAHGPAHTEHRGH